MRKTELSISWCIWQGRSPRKAVQVYSEGWYEDISANAKPTIASFVIIKTRLFLVHIFLLKKWSGKGWVPVPRGLVLVSIERAVPPSREYSYKCNYQGFRIWMVWQQKRGYFEGLELGLSNPTGFGEIPAFQGGFTQGDTEPVGLCNQWFPDGMSISSQVLGLECWQFKMDYSGAHPGSYRGKYWLITTTGMQWLYLSNGCTVQRAGQATLL